MWTVGPAISLDTSFAVLLQKAQRGSDAISISLALCFFRLNILRLWLSTLCFSRGADY